MADQQTDSTAEKSEQVEAGKDKKPKPRKTAPKTKKARKSATKGIAKKAFGQPRPFPALSLESVLKIPKIIKDMNGGNPWPPAEVAKAIPLSVKNTTFYNLTASSRDYGLTKGTRDSAEITLEPIGHDVVFAASREAELAALKQAFFHVAVFKAVFEYYQGGVLPELQYLQNTLQTTFKLDLKYHTEFVEVYKTNLDFLNRTGVNLTTGDSLPTVTQQVTSGSVVVGQPKKKSALVAFVAMPFVEKTEKYPRGFFDEVLRNFITPAATEAGFQVRTARREGSDVIQSTIVNDLLEADIVIADLTEHNPNVLFELGLRMQLEKPIALIKAKGTPPIFDVDTLLRVMDYDPNLWRSTLDTDLPRLTNHIRGSWESRDTEQSYIQILRKSH